MPRKKGDDDELTRKALELRRNGLSYREIGKQLGRSSYKTWEFISPYESHQPKITQVAELDKRIDELNARLNELTKVADDISDQLKEVKTIKDLSERMSRVDDELTSLKEGIESADLRLKKLLESVDSLQMIASLRASDREYGCKMIDKDGFCTFWRRLDQTKEVNLVKMNVKEHPLTCTACPKFEQRGKSLTQT
jgi:DNA repair exonuclease SbcCD ATPase subunit